MASYSPVFSQGFVYYAPASPNASFDVPVGYTAVVREATLFSYLGGAILSVAVSTGPGAPLVWIMAEEAEGAVSSAQWGGRVVVPGGGAIQIDTASIGVEDTVYVGGYLLTNTLS